MFERLHNARLILWWSVVWAVGTFALAPLVNYITPFLNPGYANQWTPDVYWRLVMYWHGAIFIPWVTVLALLASTKFRLDQMAGLPGRLIRESIFVGGFFAVPIAGVAGIFNVYDQFAMGVPLWTQICAFLIADEMAVALLIAMAIFPRTHGGYTKAGMPYYAVFTGVFGALSAAMIGHVGGWITWFGPNPGFVNQYINSTMYPVLGFSNNTSVITFTEDVVGSHSHLMLISLMAGVVALAAVSFGYYERWGRSSKRVAAFGFAWMIVSLLVALWMYVVSGVGNYQIPSFFVNGVNGVAGDDLTTGMVGLGAVFVLAGLLASSRGNLAGQRAPLFKDPLFLTVVASWITIYLVIPVTGFYINFHEGFFQGAGLAFDDAFNRFHQDFGFYVLPSLVTLVLALDSFGISERAKRYLGYMFIPGILLGFVFGETYTLAALSDWAYYTAFFGGFLIGAGALAGAFLVRSGGMDAGPSVQAPTLARAQLRPESGA